MPHLENQSLALKLICAKYRGAGMIRDHSRLLFDDAMHLYNFRKLSIYVSNALYDPIHYQIRRC